jgi:hypothetical protein
MGDLFKAYNDEMAIGVPESGQAGMTCKRSRFMLAS